MSPGLQPLGVSRVMSSFPGPGPAALILGSKGGAVLWGHSCL